MSAASPEMGEPETQALRESIKRLGQLVPIVTWRGEVIDGRKRLAACKALRITPSVLAIPEDATATEYAVALNVLRTHYTNTQRAMYAGKLATMTRAEANKAFRHRAISNPQLGVRSTPTVDEAAQAFGVSRNSVERAKKVLRGAHPAVSGAVERGDLTLYAAELIADALPKEDQPAKLAEVIATKGPRRNLTAKVLGTMKRRQESRRDPSRSLVRFVEQIDHLMAAVADYADAPLPEDQDLVKQWKKTVTHAIRTLVRFRRRLGTV